MKMKSIICSNHDLKRNGYLIIAKLHKLEKRKNLFKAYSAVCSEGPFVVLATVNLVEFISQCYPVEVYGSRIEKFTNTSNAFIQHLSNAASSKSRISPKVLSAYLRAYTQFFNRIIQDGTQLNVTHERLVQWNTRCVMAHMSAWNC